MIIDKIENEDLYYYKFNKKSEVVLERIGYALKFIKEHNFLQDKIGEYELEGKKIFYLITEYKTKDLENGFWESHKEYIDLHYMLKGKEKLLYSNFHNLKIQKDYVKENDSYILQGDKQGEFLLKEGCFALCFPDDAHMTGIKVKDDENIKKVIFKIAIK